MAPDAQAAVFLWLLRVKSVLAQIPGDLRFELGWYLDQIYPRLDESARRLIAGVITAAAYEAVPQEVAISDVASQRTQREIRKVEKKTGSAITTVTENTPEYFDECYQRLKDTVLMQPLPDEFQNVAPRAFEDPPQHCWEDKLIEDSRDFDAQRVRKHVWTFQREFKSYFCQLGCQDIDQFCGWLRRNKEKISALLQECESEIRDILLLDDDDEMPSEFIEPIDFRTVKMAYERGYWGQRQLRAKLFVVFRNPQALGSPEAHIPSPDKFLRLPKPWLRMLLRDAFKAQ